MQTEEEFGETVNKIKLMQFTPAIRRKGERVGRETERILHNRRYEKHKSYKLCVRFSIANKIACNWTQFWDCTLTI